MIEKFRNNHKGESFVIIETDNNRNMKFIQFIQYLSNFGRAFMKTENYCMIYNLRNIWALRTSESAIDLLIMNLSITVMM